MTKTIAFFGASTGIGLAAMKHSLAAGHQCIALCRTPAKLAAIFPPGTTPNLRVVEGNAHDEDAVAGCLVASDGAIVDTVVTTIGAVMTGFLVFDDPDVCRKGMATLLAALGRVRRDRGDAAGGRRPLIVACSTTGTSRHGRDYPFYMAPLYKLVIRVVVADKVAMEDALAASDERFTVVRPSMLTDGATTTPVRVGIEDPATGRRDVTAIGRSISREDTGKWVADNLLLQFDERYAGKMVSLTW